MYIITGGAGFIGSALVWKLNSEGITDIIIVDNLGNSSKWKNLVGLQYRYYIHKSELFKLLQNNDLRINTIVHLGACSSTTETDADYLMENNFKYSVKLAKFAHDNYARFIYSSSAATYGGLVESASNQSTAHYQSLLKLRPLNMYAYSKHLFDLWLHNHQMLNKVVGLKIFNVFGPNEYHKEDMSSIVYKIFNQIKRGSLIHLFKSYKDEFKDGEQARDFIYIKDCVDVIFWLMCNKSIAGIYNVGRGIARSYNDVAAIVLRATKGVYDKSQIRYVDMPPNIKDTYQYYTCADISKLRAAGCKIKMTTLEDAIKDYVNNYLQNNYAHLE